MAENKPVTVIYPTDELPNDKSELRSMMSSLAEAAMEKFFDGDQESAAKFALKFGCNILAGGAVAKALGGLTPFGWLLRSFGPMPSQFLTYRALPVLEFRAGMVPATSVIRGNSARLMIAQLSFSQRLTTVAKVAGARFVLVTVAFQGGYYVGTLINDNALEDETKNVIGGTINQIINEGGWRLALPDVLREGLGIAPFQESLDLSEM